MEQRFRIVYETTFTELSENESIKIKPTSALWAIVNQGSASLFLESYEIKQFDRFGIDALPIVGVAIREGFKVRNETQFQLRFAAVGTKKCFLFQTTFRKIFLDEYGQDINN